MKVTQTPIAGLTIYEPRIFADDRGFFVETYNQSRYTEISEAFVQDNLSYSKKGTLRGLHFQKPHTQGKLIFAIQGEIFDVAVDLRRTSPTFGKWFGLLLSGDNKKQLYVPVGFAHGFLVVSDTALVSYKCTDVYHPETEGSLLWNDSDVGIVWPDVGMKPILSAKDAVAPTLKNISPDRLF